MPNMPNDLAVWRWIIVIFPVRKGMLWKVLRNQWQTNHYFDIGSCYPGPIFGISEAAAASSSLQGQALGP